MRLLPDLFSPDTALISEVALFTGCQQPGALAISEIALIQPPIPPPAGLTP
jgi:hypothetical protein